MSGTQGEMLTILYGVGISKVPDFTGPPIWGCCQKWWFLFPSAALP